MSPRSSVSDSSPNAGTSGFSYKEWKGSFYPEKIAPKDMLAYYAERLPAVEINNTFYRMPKTSVLESWAASVPEQFRFAIKASRRITHIKRLREADDETDYLLRTVAVLGERLGALLFQLPPNLKLDLERLERFLDLLPGGTPAAFEFRNESWNDEAVSQKLRERGLVRVVADTDEEPAGELDAEASWGYVRLRRSGYDDSELADWTLKLQRARWNPSYVFLKHERQGPALAAKLLELAASRAPRGRAAPRRERKAG